MHGTWLINLKCPWSCLKRFTSFPAGLKSGTPHSMYVSVTFNWYLLTIVCLLLLIVAPPQPVVAIERVQVGETTGEGMQVDGSQYCQWAACLLFLLYHSTFVYSVLCSYYIEVVHDISFYLNQTIIVGSLLCCRIVVGYCTCCKSIAECPFAAQIIQLNPDVLPVNKMIYVGKTLCCVQRNPL